ncbi:MAG TPA: hypothetical protein VGW57_07535 [Chthoniobacterales bacterium]|nr:hypothetical protein [Chthoniobacterales bacterium]
MIGSFQKVLRYEVKNSYLRTIEGERWQFYDVAVETKGSAGEVIELLPLKFVKRGNAWYWAVNSESQVEQLPKGSLTDQSVALATMSPSATPHMTALNTTPSPSIAATLREANSSVHPPEFMNDQQLFEEAVRARAQKAAVPGEVMMDSRRSAIREEVRREWARKPQETIIAYSNAPTEPYRLVPEGRATTGAKVLLVPPRGNSRAVALVSIDGVETRFELPETVGNDYPLTKTAYRIGIMDYWPDFAFEGGKMISRSQKPNNPAVMVIFFRDPGAR